MADAGAARVALADGCLFIRPEYGGQTRFDEEGWLVGTPDLIVEVASSSESYDLHEKRFQGLTVLSIAPLLARAIQEVFADGSVTSLFDGNA